MEILRAIFSALADFFGIELPTVNKLTIEITLKDGTTQYRLDQYQRLNGTRLLEVKLPFDEDLEESPSTMVIAAREAYANLYLNLLDVKSNAVIDTIAGFEYIDEVNGGYFPKKGQFNLLDIDWTKSFIRYPSNTIPAAQDGKSVLIVVKYQNRPDKDEEKKGKR